MKSRWWVSGLFLLLLLRSSTAVGQAGDRMYWEAETLAANARVLGGGDLVIVTDALAGRFTFSGGKAVTFTPRSKDSAVEFVLPVDRDVVGRLKIRGVVGPSCGLYDVEVAGRLRANLNLSGERTEHMDQTRDRANGVWTARIQAHPGENPIRFVFRQAPRRGGALVIDSLELVPSQPWKPDSLDPFDAAVPDHENLGPNLLRNGDFEEFGPEDRFKAQHQPVRGWQFNSAVPQGRDCIVRSAQDACQGKQAIVLAPDPLDDHAILYQPFNVESGKRYRVSFSARGQGYLRADFYQYGGRPSAEDSVRMQNAFEATGSWRHYSFVMAPSVSGKIKSLAIALHGCDRSEVYFDEVSVREVLNAES